MKKLRKILIFILTLSLCFSLSPLNLVKAEKIKDQTFIVNEYKAFKKLNKR